ncbi:MAG: hypothetical protein P8I91_08105 [Phycisphaerales bacterium]|nr:hypothetical protein [Phycisphaerales bacterium]
MRSLCAISMLATMAALGCEIETTGESARITEEATRGPVHVLYQATPETALAGTRIEVSIIATSESGCDVQTPLLAVSEGGTLGELHVLKCEAPADIPLQSGGRQWTQTFVVDSFVPGPVMLPELSIDFTDHRATTEMTGTIEVAPLQLTIVSSLESEQSDMHDIAGWMELPGGPWWPWLLTGGGFLVVMIGGALWLMTMSRDAGPPPTAAELARAALDSLRTRGDLARGESAAFYTGLSNIVRRYIEGRFNLAAPRKTTNEFLRDAEQDTRLIDSQRSHLQEFLRTADLVKFAGHEPAIDQGHAAMAEASRFIDDCEQRFTNTELEPQREVATC